MRASPIKQPFVLDASEFAEAIRELNHRIHSLSSEIDAEELRSIHCDLSTLVRVLEVDEIAKLYDGFTKTDKASVRAALAETAEALQALPALPEHVN